MPGVNIQSSLYGGVKPMSITGRLDSERERMLGMTDEERAWRARYLKHLVLKDEPITPPNYHKELYNPIRRFYRAPLDAVERGLTPVVGDFYAGAIRRLTARLGFGLMILYGGYYYMKYNKNSWEKCGGWRLTTNRPTVYPGDPGFPNYLHRTKGKEYCILDFDKSPI